MEKALNYYKNNIKAVNEKLKKLEKVLIYFSILRFIIVILCVGIMYYFYKQSSIEAMGASFLVFLQTFIIVAFFHNERINKKKKLLIILEYNEKGIKRLDNTWREFKDIGEEFINKKHKFSNDLDLFGKSSLFQWINLTKTSFGRKNLANKMMMNSLPTRYDIQEEQEAIKELSNKREFCEKIYFEASIENKKKENIEEFLGMELIIDQKEQDADLKFSDGRRKKLRLALTEMSPGEINLFYMSLFLAITSEKRKYILIMDEPEMHIHPSVLIKL